MSHFYGILSNEIHKERTIRGFKNRGISAQLKSWRSKCDVYLYADDDGNDIYHIVIRDDSGRAVKSKTYKIKELV